MLTVVADADDGSSTFLDGLDNSSDASTIAGTHAINFVHDNNSFSALAHFVERHAVELYAQDAVLVASITSVELHEIISELFAD